MASIGSLTANLKLESAAFQRDMQRASRTMRRGAGEMNKSMASLQKVTRDLEFRATQMTNSLGPLGRGLAALGPIGIAAGAGIAAVSTALTASIRTASQFEREALRTAAVIRATGSAAGVTANQVREMSVSIGRATLQSAEGVERAAQRLMTFGTVAGDQFRRVLELAADFAALTGGDIAAAATQLGRALEAPEQGLRTLAQAGVVFTSEQRRMVQAMVEAGRAADAQEIVLSALESRIGGIGAAEGRGLAGAVDGLGESWRQLMREVGESGPLQQATRQMEGLAAAVDGIRRLAFPSPSEQMASLQAEFAHIQSQIQALTGAERFAPGRADALREEAALLIEQMAALDAMMIRRDREEAAAARAAEARRDEAEAERRLQQELEASNRARDEAARLAERIAQQRAAFIADLQHEVEGLQMAAEARRRGAEAVAEEAARHEDMTTLRQLGLNLYDDEARAILRLTDRRRNLSREAERIAEAQQLVNGLVTAGTTDTEAYTQRVREVEEALELLRQNGIAPTAEEMEKLNRAMRDASPAARRAARAAEEAARAAARQAEEMARLASEPFSNAIASIQTAFAGDLEEFPADVLADPFVTTALKGALL